MPESSPGSLAPKPDGSWWLAAPGGVYRYSDEDGFVGRQADSDLAPNAAVWINGSLWVAGNDALERWDMSGESGVKVGGSAAFDDQIAPGRTIDGLAGPGDGLWLGRTRRRFRSRP